MYLVRAARSLQLRHRLRDRSAMYQARVDPADRRRIQLELFNAQWTMIRERVPYYREIARSRNLPERFSSWEEFTNTFEPLSRDLFRSRGQDLFDPSRKPDFQRSTGGSTAQPLQFPVWKSESHFTSPDMWLGRSWYGITPSDRVFLLWGHRHLLGQGIVARFRGWQRQMRDNLVGYHRFSAYDLSPEALDRAGEVILRFRPDYVLGYSVALDMLARANEHRRNAFGSLNLKAVIATAEGFPRNDSVSVVGSVFGAPVVMEYGAVETAVVAHTIPDEDLYQVFWQSNFVEATDAGPNGGRIIRITSLYPRCFPLVRYEVGDELEPLAGEDDLSVSRFRRVIGRCNAFLIMPDQTMIHSEAVTHCVAGFKEIKAYQAVQEGSKISLFYTANQSLPIQIADNLRRSLGKIHPQLGGIAIERTNQLRQTTAGKTPMILRSA